MLYLGPKITFRYLAKFLINLAPRAGLTKLHCLKGLL